MRSKRSRFGWWSVVVLGLGLLPACGGPHVATEDLPTARETLTSVGKRLGRSKSPGELTEAARRGDRVLRLLTREERDALGRNAIRFRVNRPTIVNIAAPSRAVPFWLADQGFTVTGDKLRNRDGELVVYRKSFPAGTIGLGINALDRSSSAHYAILLQAEDGGEIELKMVEPFDLPVARVREGFSPYIDVHRPFDSIPASLKGSLLIQTRLEARHDGLLANGRVWKTHQPSGPKPDQVVVSFGEDPSKSLSFSWRTDTSVRSSALRIGPRSSPDSRQVLRGDAQPIESDGLLNDPTILRHRVVANNLSPDTSYEYVVGDGTDAGWSASHIVRTAPSTKRDFAFLYLGDAQCGLERWGELLHAARKHRPDAGFLLLAGDLVDRGNERTNWDHFFLRAAGVFEEIPFMPAVGNHEYLDKGPMIYRGTFDLPKNGPRGIDSNLVYSFEYSDAFVAVLDSNLGIHDSKLAKVQADWLDQALTRTTATWKFVTFHHPVYASHVSRENPELGAVWGPVFDKHHVDMVLQGHDHAYLRTRPMFGGSPVASPGEGTVYVVSVSGEKFYDQNPRDYTARGMTNFATYQTIDVKVREKRLTYRAFDRRGREVDALVIEKGTETRLACPPSRLINREVHPGLQADGGSR
jgi:acid phosphatase type 7